MLIQTGQAASGAPFAETEYMDVMGQITLAPSGVLAQGQVVCRDITQILGLPGLVGTSNVGYGAASNPYNCDIVCLPASANAGRVFGVYQGPTITNPSSTLTLTLLLPFRKYGAGLVLATAELTGTAVDTGNNLIAQPTTSSDVIVGSFTTGKNVGMVLATPINTQVAAAVASGSHAVTPGAMVGISTSTPLLIDTVQSGVQETVTPSAINAAGTAFTATFANAHNAGFPVVGAATAVGSVLIPVPTGAKVQQLVYCDINV